MEQNFQTSFIPKKSLVKERVIASRSVGLLMTASVFILFFMLVLTGGLFFYKGILTGKIAKMESDLSLAKNRFEPARIAELQILDRRISASSDILSKHIAITPIFKVLQQITMKTIRYTNFNYEFSGNENADVFVKMKGYGIGYRSIALQADLFTQNKNLIDPVFSNLSLDEKGNVLFDLVFSVDPSFVDFKQTLLTESSAINQENNLLDATEVDMGN